LSTLRASCRAFKRADFPADCGCGCARCVAVCDGYGPSLEQIVNFINRT